MSEQLHRTTIISGATLIDGTGTAPRTGLAVRVEGRRIAAIGPRAELALPPDAVEVDATGKYLLPGLVDAHVHLVHSGYCPRPPKGSLPAYMTVIAYRNLRSALQAGTTTVRSVGDPDHADLALRSLVERRMLLGPRIVAAGKGICMTGGHGSGGAYSMVHEVDGPQAVRAAVRAEVKAGADLIKLLSSHRTDNPEFSQEEIDAGVDEGHRLGKRVAIHAANFTGVRMACLAGADSIEHGSFVDEDSADLMAKKGITLVPTLLVKHDLVDRLLRYRETPDKFPWGDEKDLEQSLLWFRRCCERLPRTIEIVRERGVRIAAGTDFVFADLAWNQLPEEIEWLTRFGLSTGQAIVAATRNGAETLGLAAEIGSVEPGKYADLILVDRDPLADIGALRHVSWVMKEGAVVPFSPEWARRPSEAPLPGFCE